MMRSLYFRIVVTFAVALLITTIAIFAISLYILIHINGGFYESSMALELEQAQRIFETHGSGPLSSYLAETDAELKGNRYLIDGSGRDVVTGKDWSATLSLGPDRWGGPPKRDGRFIIVKRSRDGRYRLLVITPAPVGMRKFGPIFLLVFVVIALLGWALSAGIVSPLRRVASTVDAFGRGDLSVRVKSKRKDEIGDVARSFNSMADRIETLVTAERRLLQDVSHELRSPLARLSFAVELIRDSPDPEQGIARLQREIERLSQLVGTLLDMTSAEGGAFSRRMMTVKIAALAQEIIDDCRLEAEARRVSITLAISSTATVKCEPELVRRAIENVLRNAIRFAPPDTAVETRVEDQGDRIVVSIRDYGSGVPPEALERIFDAFYRVDDSRNSASGGAGLGLSIARRAVLLHQGEIVAENASPGLRVRIAILTATSATQLAEERADADRVGAETKI
jgi:signal transduction histidine kinase